MGETEKGISVVICCYNSQDRISRTLEHLIAQQLDAAIPFEIIVVDNACTDQKAALAESVLSGSPRAHQYAVVREAEPGLSNARRTGIERARYEYIIFCDDDNWLSADYARQVWVLFERMARVGIRRSDYLRLLLLGFRNLNTDRISREYIRSSVIISGTHRLRSMRIGWHFHQIISDRCGMPGSDWSLKVSHNGWCSVAGRRNRPISKTPAGS